MKVWATGLFVITCVIAGCGGDKGSEAKIILENGNTLKGEDAKAYGRRFVPPDAESRAACRSIGVALPKTPEERQAEADAREEAAEGARQEENRRRTEPATAVRGEVARVARRELGDRYRLTRADANGVEIVTTYGEYEIPDSVVDAVCKAVISLPAVKAARSGGQVLPIALVDRDESTPANCDL